jgi:hypothetical protein
LDFNLINALAASISAVSACGSTYFAARVIRDNREARQLELDAARPYFTFTEFGLRRSVAAKALSAETDVLDPRAARIEGLITNVGRRAAIDLAGVVVILPIDREAKVGTFLIGIADDVAAKSEWHIGTGHLSVIPEELPETIQPMEYVDPGFFIMVHLRYKDPLTSKSYTQRTFMRWPGIANGIVSANLVAVTHEEKAAIIRHHELVLLPYLASH